MARNESLLGELIKAKNCKNCATWRQKTEALTNKYFLTIKNMRVEIK